MNPSRDVIRANATGSVAAYNNSAKNIEKSAKRLKELAKRGLSDSKSVRAKKIPASVARPRLV
jgi:hypothetical protein